MILLTPREISFHERKDLFSLQILGLYCPNFTGVGGLCLHGSGALLVIVTNVAVWVFELLLYLVLGDLASLFYFPSEHSVLHVDQRSCFGIFGASPRLAMLPILRKFLWKKGLNSLPACR